MMAQRIGRNGIVTSKITEIPGLDPLPGNIGVRFDGAARTAPIVHSGDSDYLILPAGSVIDHDIDLGAGNDVLISYGNAYVGGAILLGDDADSATISGLSYIPYLDGGAGFDTLHYDTSGLAGFGNPEFLSADGGTSFTGALDLVTDGVDLGVLTFVGFEALDLTLSDTDNHLTLDAAPLGRGATLSLDGGLGTNYLVADFGQLGDASFILAADGAIASTYGSFARFQGFDLTLGSGTNLVATGALGDRVTVGAGASSISTGAGADIITSRGGIDQVDGGADEDSWSGAYATATSLTFSWDGIDAQLSNGTTVTHVEHIDVATGSGDDRFTITNANVNVDAGAGDDTLLLDLTRLPRGDLTRAGSSIGSDPTGGLFGAVYDGVGYSTFGGIEKLTARLNDGDKILTVDAAALGQGATLSVDGGEGNNRLKLDFSQLADTSFVVDDDGSIAASHGDYARFQTFELRGGSGTNRMVTGAGDDIVFGGSGMNSINTGAGNDTIHSRGVDQIDGGGGNDNSWYADYGSATTPLDYNLYSDRITISNGTTAIHVTDVHLTGGSADDSFTINPAAAARLRYIEGGGGSDSLIFHGSEQAFLFIDASLSNGLSGSAGDEVSFPAFFAGIEHIDYRLSEGDDDLRLFSSAPLTTAVRVDGRGGDDTVHLARARANYAVTRDGAGGYIVSDVYPDDGDAGSFLVTNVEHIQFYDQRLDLPAYGPGLTLVGTPGNDLLTGGGLDDILIGLAGNDIMDGGGGEDIASYADAASRVKVDLARADAQNTRDGRDRLSNIEDVIGSDFSDRLSGNADANRLEGGDGADMLYGNGGADHLIGGAGNDRIDGGTGADLMEGGAGNDRYYVDESGDAAIEGDADDGLDTVYASVDFTLGANIERLTLLGDAPLRGTGNALANRIVANAAGDRLEGGGGDDDLVGGDGADLLIGGAGKDRLTGGLGPDIFQLDIFEPGTRDSIKGFESGSDRIALSATAFAALGAYGLGQLDDGELAFGKAATSTSQHLIYNPANGALFYDVDGKGGIDQIAIATLAGHPTIVASDFMII